MIFRRGHRRRKHRRRSHHSRRRSQSKVVMAVAACAMITVGLHAFADDNGTGQKFKRRPYVAIGGGVTRLEPKPHTSALTVAEAQSTGIHLAVGYDIARWLSAEIYFAELGAADIDFLDEPIGDIAYQEFGATAIAYLYNSRSGFVLGDQSADGLFRREGLSLYGRFGIGGMNNESDVPHFRDHASHATYGAGVEYGFRNGFALRGEAMAFDTDARYVTASLVKRFGHVPEQASAKIAQRTAPAAEIAAAAPAAAIETSTVHFAFDKSDLSTAALAELDVLLDEIRDTGQAMIIEGHADWMGSERYNQGLSLQRAEAVQHYLKSRGIKATRIAVEAMGETHPLTTNSTDKGRAENRRAIVLLQ
ncbi:MAG: OmpA family protein [Granulosicoccus sp.]